MSTLNIVLVSPQIPQNTGNIARTCAACHLRLHLVHPLGFAIDDAKLKRAGLDYWHLLDITHYESLDVFLDQHRSDPLYLFSTKGGTVYSHVNYPKNSYLLFGREDQGLPVPLLRAFPHSTLRIPIQHEARSLNLSNSVAIAAFEVLRQWDFPQLEPVGRLP